MSRWYYGLLFAIIICLGVVGRIDYEASLAEQKQYCEDVRDGYVHDWKHIYDDQCKKYLTGP